MDLEPLTMEELKQLIGDQQILISQLQKTLGVRNQQLAEAKQPLDVAADIDINRTNGAAEAIPLEASQ